MSGADPFSSEFSTEFHPTVVTPPPPPAAPAPVPSADFYDIHDVLGRFCPGVVIDRDIETALLLQYQAQGYQPLTQSQVVAIVLEQIPNANIPNATPVFAGLPQLPRGLPRFADSNPASSDNWAMDNRRASG